MEGLGLTDTFPTRIADFEQLTATIVRAFVSGNAISASDVPKLIVETHTALKALSTQDTTPAPERPAPAVAIRKSITPDCLICLEDGKKFRSLKRHLKTAHNMTPDQYRARWDLASDYPMTAPSYSRIRSGLAKANGLGLRQQDELA
jgi:predicted transcriptional regulator